MEWDVPRFGLEVAKLQTLAVLKYDEYGGYRPGVKFAENLARWLEQFEPEERQTAYDFVLSRLIFISDGEMAHLIEIAYPDFLEPHLIRRAAADLGVPHYKVHEISNNPSFLSLRRRSLVLGLSDGARLDRLRRTSQLSHEQFGQSYEIDPELASRFKSDLEQALTTQSWPGDPTFRHVFLVDDFSGSGQTLIREDADNPGNFKGKLVRFHDRLRELQAAGVVAEDATVCILLYVASEQAQDHLQFALGGAGIGGWSIMVIQSIGPHLKVDVTDPEMAELCRSYFDPSSSDQHKKDTPIGYQDCALPLVLGHNTPNNSVCLLWLETSETEGMGRRALFPRYERHHKDRP